MTENIQVIYKSIPNGVPNMENFEIRRAPLSNSLNSGEILLRTLYLSVDPYIRGRMRNPEIESYIPALTPGCIMEGEIIGQVVRSMSPEYFEGDILKTFGKWEQFTVVQPNILLSTIKIEKENGIPISYYLGVLGSSGLTAYAGLHKICEPFQPGQTILVSAALGGVGQIVGQYAKCLGFHVVGTAGNDEKVKYLIDELGFDCAFNYKTVNVLSTKLAEVCPNGIDIYFDNVGGEMLDAALVNCNKFARIPICGQISQYNKLKPDPLTNFHLALTKRIRLEGFLILDEMEKYSEQIWRKFKLMLKNGQMKYREHFTNGIQNAPMAFIDMLNGRNFGKAIVTVAELD